VREVGPRAPSLVLWHAILLALQPAPGLAEWEQSHCGRIAQPSCDTGTRSYLQAGTTMEIDMFTGLKRSLLVIIAMVTIVPWGMMQLVQ
jgi:hypothetical protein